MARFVAVAIGVLTLAAGGTAAGERPGRIAFARDAGLQSELFTVAPDGRGLRRLTRNRVEDNEPKWSPEGRRLLSFGITGLVIRDMRGQVLRRLPRTCCMESKWSRDGRSIAYLEFACDDQTGKGDPLCAHLWVVRSDGSSQRRLVQANVDTIQHTDRRYAWSPDGSKIVYTAYTPNMLLVRAPRGAHRGRCAGPAAPASRAGRRTGA